MFRNRKSRTPKTSGCSESELRRYGFALGIDHQEVWDTRMVADPPPPDPPPTFTFWIFREGSFIGTELLIRSDLYTDQLCESTGEPYVYAALIGYYECIHTTGN